jgi:DnaD/phage-associated family protein
LSYSINLGSWNSVFAVPCSLVDDHLKLAGSVQLKVLLWVLRHAGEPFELQQIADALGIDRADAGDALRYWQETGLVAASASGERLSPAPAAAREEPGGGAAFQPQAAAPAPKAAKPKHILSRPQKPDSEFVAKRMTESTEIACLMQSAQEILGRLISSGESATLLMIHDDFGLPSDVIVMLLQYAASVGRANMRYIEKTAMNWADDEINTHEKAEERLRLLSEKQKAWRTVEQAIGIPHRAPSSREEAFAPVWVRDWGFGPDMIREAYDRTIDGAGKYKPGYMNRILERWHKEGVTTTKQAAEEQMERASSKKKAAKREKPAPTFDIDEYEATSIYDTKDTKG